MTKPQTRFSVAIPVYEESFFLRESIESVIRNLGKHDEVFVIDDGSHPKNVEKIRACIPSNDDRFRFTSIPHSGPSGALNAALEMAEGKYFSTFSSDDLMLNSHLDFGERILNEKADLSFSVPVRLDRHSKIGPKSVDKIFKATEKSIDQRKVFSDLFYVGNFLCAPSMLVKTACARQIGGFHCGFLQLQDYHFTLKAMIAGFTVSVSENSTIAYRRDNGIDSLSASSNNGRHDIELPLVLEDAIADARGSSLVALFSDKLGNNCPTKHTGLLKAHILMSHSSPSVRRRGLEGLLLWAQTSEQIQVISDMYGLRGNEISDWLDVL